MIYVYQNEDVWRKSLFFFFSSYLASSLSPLHPEKKKRTWWGVSVVCGINGAPLLDQLCPLLSTFHMGPPRPPHWDLRARSSNKDSAGGSSTEIWLTVEWKRKEFWQTENGGSEKQLYMSLRGAATTYERERATRSQGMRRTLRNVARGWIHEFWLTLNHLCALNEADVHRHEKKIPKLPLPKTCVSCDNC